MDLQLMQSSSEINTISKRAARAVGYSWGVAEEVGKCISSIEMFGISGVENLNNYFKTIKGIEPEGPKQIEKTNKLNDKSLCPIYTGLKLIDNYKSVDGIKALKFINLDYPLLLLPFVNKLSYLIGKRIEISIDDINAECNLNTCVLADHQIKNLGDGSVVACHYHLPPEITEPSLRPVLRLGHDDIVFKNISGHLVRVLLIDRNP